jgi:hypothetical protein
VEVVGAGVASVPAQAALLPIFSLLRLPDNPQQLVGTSPGLTSLDLLAERSIFPNIENPRSVKDRYQFLCPLPGHEGNTHRKQLVSERTLFDTTFSTLQQEDALRINLVGYG